MKFGDKIILYAEAMRYANVSHFTDRREIKSLITRLHPTSSDIQLIRLGPNSDGGYLVPDDFAGIEACFSPGVDRISGFEKDCAEMGIKVFMADYSVDMPLDSHELFNFTKKYVGVTTNDKFITIDDWVTKSLPKSQNDLILQMDIEGYEYEVILNASDALMKRFRIIVSEFHSLHELWDKPFYLLASRVFEKILQTHTCMHIHPNNACGTVKKNGIEIPVLMEFTFLRNDRIKHAQFAKKFPHPLDYDNTNNTSFSLPTCWYNK